MTLTDFQLQIGDDGPILGGDEGYRVEDVEGLGREIRGLDAERENADGAVQGPEYATARTVTITMTITGSTPEETRERVLALGTVWNQTRRTEGVLGTAALHFKMPGAPAQQIPYGRPRRWAPNWRRLALSYVPVVATYYAPDPRILAEVERVIDLEIGDTNITLPNDGDHPAAVVWDVYGSVSAPGVIRSEASRFDLDAVVSDGAFFRVRSDPHTVVRSTDAANRYQDLTGTFLEIPAGGALFRAVGTGPGSNAKVRATYRDTWSSA